MSDWLRWLAFGAGGILFVGCTASNAATLVRYLVSKRSGSMIPVLGGLAGALGLFASPQAVLRDLWWLPLVADPGSAFFAVASLVSVAWRQGKKGDPEA